MYHVEINLHLTGGTAPGCWPRAEGACATSAFCDSWLALRIRVEGNHEHFDSGGDGRG